jgi:hypothetical protein
MEDCVMKRLLLLVAALAFVVVCADLSISGTELNGTYISKDNKNEYITFSPDGKFFLKQQKKPHDSNQPYITTEGTYTTDGNAVMLRLPDGGEAAGTIQGGTFLDNERKPWVKAGEAQKPNQNVQFPKRSIY